MTLKTRKPTGKTPPPVILLEGDEGAGKSWAAAELSASDKVGFTAWLQVGTESTADQYGEIPGARYRIIEHDGTWNQIYGQVREAKKDAENARTRGEKPFVLVIDQIGGIWDMLSEWAENRARSTDKAKAKIAADPNVEIEVTNNYWNDAKARWKKLMTIMLTFPGIVIILSRGRETLAFEKGKPATGKSDYKVDGEKNMKFDVPVWIRMTRDAHPVCVKLRSVTNPIRMEDRNRPIPSFTLEKFIFEVMGYDPAQSDDAAGMVPMVAGADAPLSEMASVILLAVESAESLEQLRSAHGRIKPAVDATQITEAEAGNLYTLVSARKVQLEPTTSQQPEMAGASS